MLTSILVQRNYGSTEPGSSTLNGAESSTEPSCGNLTRRKRTKCLYLIALEIEYCIIVIGTPGTASQRSRKVNKRLQATCDNVPTVYRVRDIVDFQKPVWAPSGRQQLRERWPRSFGKAFWFVPARTRTLATVTAKGRFPGTAFWYRFPTYAFMVVALGFGGFRRLQETVLRVRPQMLTSSTGAVSVMKAK